METPDREREPLLRQLLDALGLQYAIRHADDGSPYAGFRYELGGHFVHVVARLLGRALRFRAERVIELPVDDDQLRLSNEINSMWRAGRMDAARGWSLTSWAYGADDRFAPAAVQFAFEALLDAADRLTAFPGARFADLSPARPARDDEERAQSMLAMVNEEIEHWPPVAAGSASTIDRVAAVLGRHAQVFHRVADGRVLTTRLTVAGERDFLVDLFDPDGSTLFIRARHDRAIKVADTHPTWLGLQTLNERLALGAAVVEEDAAQYRLSLPVAWTPIDEGLVDWILSRAHASMLAIEQAQLPTAP